MSVPITHDRSLLSCHCRVWGDRVWGWSVFVRGIVLAFLLLPLVASRADVLVVGAKSHQGTFEGFERDQFLFRKRNDELLRQDRATVGKLTLDAPRRVTYQQLGRKTAVSAELLGYAAPTFTIRQGGANRDILGMQIRQIDMVYMGEGSTRSEDIPRPRTVLDLAGVANRTDLTAGQRAALNRYRTARRAYDTFVDKSTALVSELDRSAGARRDQLLVMLRQRKQDEQPLTRALEGAEAALLAVLPLSHEMEKPSGASTGRTTASSSGGSMAPPETAIPGLEEGEVLLLDLTGVEKTKGLSRMQVEAIAEYKAARARYERITAADGEDRGNARIRALAGMREAQEILFRAFPGLKLVD